MQAGRSRFGPALVAWTDAAAAAPLAPGVLRSFGDQQVRRYTALRGVAAQRFLAGRALLAELIAELSGTAEYGFTTTCERCGADHGRPRLMGAPVAVSVSYAGSMVAVAGVHRADADAVGIDIERASTGESGRRLAELAPLFAPHPPPDLAGWTLLEAALKADGRGIAVDVAEARVGARGTGELPGSHAVRLPGRAGEVDAAVIAGPDGYVLSSAVARPARA